MALSLAFLLLASSIALYAYSLASASFLFLSLNENCLKITCHDFLAQIDHQLTVANASEIEYPRFNLSAKRRAENVYSNVSPSNDVNVRLERNLFPTGKLI